VKKKVKEITIFVLLISFMLLSEACSTVKKAFNPDPGLKAKVENVLLKKNYYVIVTNKGTFICGNCDYVIHSQKYYRFYLEGNKVIKMEIIKETKKSKRS